MLRGAVAFLFLVSALGGTVKDVHSSHNALESFSVRNIQQQPHDDSRLSTSITNLKHSGQWVNVSWHGVQDPQDDDYIALYVPANASVYETSPVKYQWAVTAPTHRTEGAGSLRYMSQQGL